SCWHGGCPSSIRSPVSTGSSAARRSSPHGLVLWDRDRSPLLRPLCAGARTAPHPVRAGGGGADGPGALRARRPDRPAPGVGAAEHLRRRGAPAVALLPAPRRARRTARTAPRPRLGAAAARRARAV